MTANIFTEDFKQTPYWWDGAPLASSPQGVAPAEVDVAIVGAGYTGLHAAIQTARAGLSTSVFDAEAIGFGCSSRNGGQISPEFKYSLKALTRRYGADTARALSREGQASVKHLGDFIGTEKIVCDYAVNGRLHAAHSSRAWRGLQAEVEEVNVERDAVLIPAHRLAGEIGSSAYHGAVVYPHDASVDPARYHAGLVKVASAAGAQIVANSPVTDIKRSGQLFQLQTPQQTVRASQVLVATNGYTGPATPWLRRRVIPIGSYMIATEQIPQALMDQLFPTDRVLTDTRKLIYYYRPSPDRRRIIFGGRVSLNETDSRISGVRLLKELRRLFPELQTTRISHSWSGTVAFSFDSMMHCGQHEGIHYAMAYCGSGVAMSGYLGMRMGHRMAGNLSGNRTAVQAGQTVFDSLEFSTRPLYTGVPWFLAPSVFAYRVHDRLLS